MITGVHAIIYSTNADADRSFLHDLRATDAVDAGAGWLNLALPPAELAVHPTADSSQHELYLMCDDISATAAELEGRGVELVEPVQDEGWGLLTALRLPGPSTLGLYEPRHPSPLAAFADQGT